MLFASHLWGMCNFDFFDRIANSGGLLMAKNILKIQYTVEIILNGFHLMIFQNN